MLPEPCTPVPRTTRTRLHFARSMALGCAITPPLAAGLLAHNLRAPTAATFKTWMNRWARTALSGMGVRLDVDQRAPLPHDEPVVLVANHQNMLDILVCSAAVEHPHGFAAKAELRRTPIVGAVVARSACLFVDRSTARRAAQSVAEAAALIRGGNSVLIYPEGERTYGPTLRPFLRGAFLLAVEAGVPLVPVTQLNNFAVLDERWRVSRPGRVRVVLGEPIPTADRSRSDIPALMAEVRAQMEAELAAIEAVQASSVSSSS